MPIAAKRVSAWSFSRLRLYEECAQKFKYTHIEKRDTGPEGPALARGSMVHKMAEAWLKDPTKPLPQDLWRFAEEFKVLAAQKAKPEMQIAFNREWEPLADWFDRTTYARVVFDAFVLTSKPARAIDFKTGKRRSEKLDLYIDQLGLYAVGMLSAFPMIDEVKAELWFLDEGTEPDVVTLHRNELLERQRYWELRSFPMLVDVDFVATPGRHCRYCFFNAMLGNGGPCHAPELL